MIGKKITLKKNFRVYSSYAVCFSSLTEDLEFCTHLVACKEYVLDSYYHALFNNHTYWDEYYNDVFYRKCSIEPFLVVVQANGYAKGIKAIENIEKKWGFEPSIFHPTGNDEIFAVKVSSGWLHASPLLSFFLLAFRQASTVEEQDPAKWIFPSWPMLSSGASARYKKFIESDDPRKLFFPTHRENWEALIPLVKDDVRFIHDKSGIYGFVNRYIPIAEWNKRLD